MKHRVFKAIYSKNWEDLLSVSFSATDETDAKLKADLLREEYVSLTGVHVRVEEVIQ